MFWGDLREIIFYLKAYLVYLASAKDLNWNNGFFDYLFSWWGPLFKTLAIWVSSWKDFFLRGSSNQIFDAPKVTFRKPCWSLAGHVQAFQLIKNTIHICAKNYQNSCISNSLFFCWLYVSNIPFGDTANLVCGRLAMSPLLYLNNRYISFCWCILFWNAFTREKFGI